MKPIKIETIFEIVGIELISVAVIINIITWGWHYFINDSYVMSNGFAFILPFVLFYGFFAIFYFLFKMFEEDK